MSTVDYVANQGINALGSALGLDSLNQKGRTRGVDDPLPPTSPDAIDALFEMDLPELPASMRGVSLDQIMKAIADEARRAGVQSAVESLEIQGDELRAAHEEKLEALKKQIDELSQKDFWSGFCKAFQIIGAIFGAIASVATAVVGGITGNPFLIAAGVMGAAMAIESTLSLATDGEISLTNGFTKLGEACGMSQEDAKWFGFGMNMLVVLAGTAVSFAAAGGASAASKTVETASKSVETLSAMAKISAYSNLGSGITGVGSGIGNAVLTMVEYKIANLKADGVDIDALLEQLRATMKVSQDFIESEMKTAEALIDKVMDIVEDCNATATAVLTVAPTTA